MSRYRYTAPDGSKYEFDGPDNASEDDLRSYVESEVGSGFNSRPSANSTDVRGANLPLGPDSTTLRSEADPQGMSLAPKLFAVLNTVDKYTRVPSVTLTTSLLEGKSLSAAKEDVKSNFIDNKHPMFGDWVYDAIKEYKKGSDLASHKVIGSMYDWYVNNPTSFELDKYSYNATTKRFERPDGGNLFTPKKPDPDKVQAAMATSLGLVGDIALDPTTWATKGQSVAAKYTPQAAKNMIKLGPEAAGKLVEEFKTTHLGDTLWKMFSTKHNLSKNPKFAEMESRFNLIVRTAKDRSVDANKSLRIRIDELAGDLGIDRKEVYRFITEGVERGPMNVHLENMPFDQKMLLATDDRVNTVISDLSKKNADQAAAEIAGGVKLSRLGEYDSSMLGKLNDSIAKAKANNELITINPETGKKTKIENLVTRAKELEDAVNSQDRLDYFFHAVTPEFKAAVVQKAKKAGQGRVLMYSPFHASTLNRSFGNKSIAELNDLAKKGELPGYEGMVFEDGAFFDNPAVVQALRDMRHQKVMGVANLFTEAKSNFGVSRQTLVQLAKQEGFKGKSSERALEFLQSMPAEKKQAILDNPMMQFNVDDLKFMNHAMAQGYAFPTEIAERLGKYHDVVFDPKRMNAFVEGWDEVTNWWKAWTLSIFPSYHTRNSVSNYWNNFVDGVDNNAYGIARDIQDDVFKGSISLPGGNSISYDEIRSHIDDLGIRGGGLSGVEVESAIMSDLGVINWKQLAKTGGLSKNNPIISYGRGVGKYIEDNARIANFVDGLKRGLSVDEAAARVKKDLFDYADLTEFEQNTMKRIMPFYTWTRKNVPYQMEMLIKHPGKYKAIDTTRREIEARSETPEEQLLSSQYLDNYPTRIKVGEDGKPQYFLLGGWWPGADLWKLAANPSGMGMDLLHPIPKSVYELGVAPIISKEINNEFYGQDLFNGRQLDPQLTTEFLGFEVNDFTKQALKNIRVLNEIDRFMQAASPNYPKYPNLLDEKKVTLEEALLRYMTGINTYSVDFETLYRQKAQQDINSIKAQQQRIIKQIFRGSSPEQMDKLYEELYNRAGKPGGVNDKRSSVDSYKQSFVADAGNFVKDRPYGMSRVQEKKLIEQMINNYALAPVGWVRGVGAGAALSGAAAKSVYGKELATTTEELQKLSYAVKTGQISKADYAKFVKEVESRVDWLKEMLTDLYGK